MLDGSGCGSIKMVEIKPKPKCCRNLFGSPSGKEREHMKKIYSECMKEDINIGKEKYEYDIVSDTPLSDRWELTTSAPEFYTRQYTSREERLNPLKRKMDVEREPDNVESQNTATCNSRPLRQQPLTNYLKKRKRADNSLTPKQIRL